MTSLLLRDDVRDPAHLRSVFGAFPTGVMAVAAVVDDRPVGLAASSFTSVSLDPPLVSICIQRGSRTWASLRRAPHIGVSILAVGQEQVSRQLAARADDRFAGLAWERTPDGAVLLPGASGWLEVSVSQEIEAGDHVIALLEVHDLRADHAVRPLVFHASRYVGLDLNTGYAV